MPTMIKDLKRMAAGTEVVGIALAIKVGRKAERDPDGSIWQSVVFIDSSGELPGRILLADNAELGEHKDQAGYRVWKTKEHIVVMRGQMQDADERKKETEKLVVFECFDAVPPLSYDQTQAWQSDDADEWREARKEEIRGKVRHGVSCAVIQGCMSNPQSHGNLPLLEYNKASINAWVDFIITGE